VLDFARNHSSCSASRAIRARRGRARCRLSRAQRTVHPDRHAASDDASRRLAPQAARVNEAYRTCDRSSARYLLACAASTRSTTDTTLDLDFRACSTVASALRSA
jgi:hypothetical protein